MAIKHSKFPKRPGLKEKAGRCRAGFRAYGEKLSLMRKGRKQPSRNEAYELWRDAKSGLEGEKMVGLGFGMLRGRVGQELKGLNMHESNALLNATNIQIKGLTDWALNEMGFMGDRKRIYGQMHKVAENYVSAKTNPLKRDVKPKKQLAAERRAQLQDIAISSQSYRVALERTLATVDLMQNQASSMSPFNRRALSDALNNVAKIAGRKFYNTFIRKLDKYKDCW